MHSRLLMLALISTTWVGSARGEPGRQTAVRASSCAPSALLSGEEELVRELTLELGLLGVSTRATATCPAAAANVERGSGGVVIALSEPSGRRALRTLSTVRIAATWIDSWLHDDLGAPLLAARPMRRPAANLERSVPSGATPIATTAVASAPAPAKHSKYRVAAAYEARYPTGASAGKGLHADACAVLGRACLGIRLAAAEFSHEAISDIDYAKFSQTSVELLAQVQTHVPVGQATLIPSLGIGASRVETERDSELTCNLIAPPDGTCDAIEDVVSKRASWAAAAEFGLSASFPVARRTRFALGGSLFLRPGGSAKESLILDEAPPPCPDPASPTCSEGAPGSVIAILPADPVQSWKFFLGLQVDL